MPLEPENECPECGGWKGEDFELCRSCAESAKEEREEPVLVEYHARMRETERAVLFKLPPGGFTGRDLWVPKSQLVDEDALAKTICVARWWAEDNDLAYQD
jgi:hypothetical protein